MIFIYSKKPNISEYNVRQSKKCGVLSDLIVSVRQVSFIVNPYLIYYENSLRTNHRQSNTSVHLLHVIGTLTQLSGLLAPHHYLVLQCHVAMLRHADTCRSGMSMYESLKRRLSDGSRRFHNHREGPY